MKFKFFGWLSVFLLIFFFTKFANATVYMDIDNDGQNEPCYIVDQNHPNASNSWTREQNNEEHPWKDAWYGAQQLYPGDVLLIKAGYYFRYTGHRYLPGIMPSRSGTKENPIIIKAYPGDDVYILGGIENGEPTLETSPTLFKNPAIGTFGKDYIIIDGFKIYGAATLWSTTGSIIQNCEIWGGNDKEFGCCIRLEWANECKIRNNIVHDNVIAGDGSGGPANCPLLMEYDSSNCIIENNYFYNSVGPGIKLKDHPVNIHVRYNIISNCSLAGVRSCNQDNPNNDNSIYVYQNIIKECREGVALNVSHLTYAWIYNNVFYNNGAGIKLWLTGIQEVYIYNNIIKNCSSRADLVVTDDPVLSVTELNYNDYHSSSPKWEVKWRIVAKSLDEWKSWLSDNGYMNKDTNSIADDPLFVNPEAGDFHLEENSPCRNTGKDGVNMGCYITGDEIIGPILNQGPQVSNESPARNATDVPRNTNISFDITDSDGVDQSSISVSVNGNNVTSSCTITAISNGFHILYDPPQDFSYGQTVTVTISASDTQGNTTNDSWSFTIQQQQQANVPGSPTITKVND